MLTLFNILFQIVLPILNYLDFISCFILDILFFAAIFSLFWQQEFFLGIFIIFFYIFRIIVQLLTLDDQRRCFKNGKL